jgi:hypothetical protein
MLDGKQTATQQCEVGLDMDSAFVTGLAAVLGSLAGASDSIATTWMTERSHKIRERAQSELHRRETLYGEFISEVSRLTADAFDHSLERPETLAIVYGLLGRMHLVASAPVMKAAEECCRYLVDLYSKNMTQEQIVTTLRETSAHPLTAFGSACRLELDEYVAR